MTLLNGEMSYKLTANLTKLHLHENVGLKALATITKCKIRHQAKVVLNEGSSLTFGGMSRRADKTNTYSQVKHNQSIRTQARVLRKIEKTR